MNGSQYQHNRKVVFSLYFFGCPQTYVYIMKPWGVFYTFLLLQCIACCKLSVWCNPLVGDTYMLKCEYRAYAIFLQGCNVPMCQELVFWCLSTFDNSKAVNSLGAPLGVVKSENM